MAPESIELQWKEARWHMGDWMRTLEASFGANAGNIAEDPKVNMTWTGHV